MASEDMSMGPTQRLDNSSLNSQLLFGGHEFDSAPHRRGVGDPGPKAREIGGFMDEKLFTVDHRDRYFSPEYRQGGVFEEERRGGGMPEGRSWHRSGPASSSEEEDEEEEEEEEEDDDESDGEVEGLVVGIDSGNGGKNSHGSGGGSIAIEDKIGGGNSKNHASFGSSTRQMVMKDGGGVLQTGADANRVSTSENGQQGSVGNFQKMVTIAEVDGDMYYLQLLQGTEGSSRGHKDLSGDNVCGFSGRKDGSVSSDPGESLRAIFSDPITGALMDDAMILPCGHSFGGGGIQQVLKLKACYTCSHPVSEDSVAPNLSLRTAVQAFRREEDMLVYRASKRRRERFEQDKGNYGDSSLSDTPRGKGVQFPFVVTDRVIIKGNKRTPQRFVGREAIVTTQCLNGWYVVKTLDNAESVKLQYRSLEKVLDSASSKPVLNKMAPNWL